MPGANTSNSINLKTKDAKGRPIWLGPTGRNYVVGPKGTRDKPAIGRQKRTASPTRKKSPARKKSPSPRSNGYKVMGKARLLLGNTGEKTNNGKVIYERKDLGIYSGTTTGRGHKKAPKRYILDHNKEPVLYTGITIKPIRR